jgi:hypothetical protein
MLPSKFNFNFKFPGRAAHAGGGAERGALPLGPEAACARAHGRGGALRTGKFNFNFNYKFNTHAGSRGCMHWCSRARRDSPHFNVNVKFNLRRAFYVAPALGTEAACPGADRRGGALRTGMFNFNSNPDFKFIMKLDSLRLNVR